MSQDAELEALGEVLECESGSKGSCQAAVRLSVVDWSSLAQVISNQDG